MSSTFNFTWQAGLKYLLEGVAVSAVSFIVSGKSGRNLYDVLLIGLTATVVFFILDQFAPLVVGGARQGAGFGVGYGLVGGGNTTGDTNSESGSVTSTEKVSEPATETFETETENSSVASSQSGGAMTGVPNVSYDVPAHNNAAYEEDKGTTETFMGGSPF